MDQPPPRIAEIVHYVADGVCRAAIITKVRPAGKHDTVITGRPPRTTVAVCILHPTGMDFDSGIAYSADAIDAGGGAATRMFGDRTWHRPGDCEP